jgi:hypothetical protein
MSPTSYQTAPPRISIIINASTSVKPRAWFTGAPLEIAKIEIAEIKIRTSSDQRHSEIPLLPAGREISAYRFPASQPDFAASYTQP